jgi:hypothetical protein
MKTRVVTMCFEHEREVAKRVDELQDEGYEVTEIKRISRMFFLSGEDVTEITYFKIK